MSEFVIVWGGRRSRMGWRLRWIKPNRFGELAMPLRAFMIITATTSAVASYNFRYRKRPFNRDGLKQNLTINSRLMALAVESAAARIHYYGAGIRKGWLWCHG